MDPITTGALISGGTQLLGGLMGRSKGGIVSNIKKQADANAYASRVTFDRQMANFKRHGIHKLYGISGGTAQYSPSFTGSNNSLGESIQNMGQNIQRATEAYSSKQERLSNRLLETQVEGQELENAKKAADLAVRTHAGTPGLNMNPLQHGDLIRNRDGSVMLAMSEDTKNRLDEDLLGQFEWNLKNRIPFYLRRAGLRHSSAGKENNKKRGFNKFTHAAKTLYNRYVK